MSVTLKQIEALHWIAALGSLADAAERLHLAPSTLSKRVQELEATLGTTLLDRNGRGVTLTRAARELLPLAGDLLRLGAKLHEVASGPRAFRGPFRIGVTELVALTWLPRLIVAMKQHFPAIIPEPEVDASVPLYARLAERRLDLVIGLDPPGDAMFTAIPLGRVTMQWMSAPGVGPPENELPLGEIVAYPILAQGEGSGLQRPVVEWLRARGITLTLVVKCNSLIVLSSLAMAGLGTTFLTEQYFHPELQSGRLRIIRTRPALPPIRYYASFRSDALDPLAERVARLGQRCCDFSLRRG